MLGLRSTAACCVGFGALVAACGGNGGNGGNGGGGDAGGQDAGPALDSGGGVDAGGSMDSSVGDSGVTDGGGSDADAALGPHAAQPQVIYAGGTVLTAPKVQLIVYAEDPLATDADDMVTELTQTATWQEQTGEYGVGALTKLPTIQIQGTPPMTLNDNTGNVTPFEQTLVTNTTGLTPVWGAADPSTIYAFVLPAVTNIQSGGNCCTDFYGYHYEVPVSGSTSIPYAIICNCTSPQGDPLTPLENVTTTISHELAESATDPFPSSSPAYSSVDNNDIVWAYATGGEVADMCEFNADSNYTPPGSTYMVQRSWSNAAAMAGTNPCVPVPMPTPFFESMAVLTDSISLSGTPSKGVTIPIGSSKTIDVQLFSTAPTSGPWTVAAYDLNDYLGYTANTTASLDTSTGSNGDVIHLTIHVTSADPNLGGEGFVLVSDLGGQENITMGAVGN